MTIRCENLLFTAPGGGFRLNVPALDFASGERVALVGPSGSGKTTLLDLIAGVRLPEAGRITVGETVLTGLAARERRAFRLRQMGFVFQSFDLFGHLTVWENIMFPVVVAGGKRKERAAAEAELARLTAACGLSGTLSRRADRLSRGEQQRVALCRALVHRPAVLLADEPTGNLDPGHKTAAIKLLLAAVADQGATLITATHDATLLPLFDRVIDVTTIGGGG